MTIAIFVGLGCGLVLTLLLLIYFLPDKIQYIETITVEAPIKRVYDAIRYQEQLMEWSAWPTETNSLCEVANTDGVVGAQTIFQNKKGKKFGYQEVTELVENERVNFYLKSHVAPFEDDVRLDFILKQITESKTEVNLWFKEKLKKPAFLIAYFGNIINWVHSMHLKDLGGLKRYVEESKKYAEI
ncbi:MAG: SRPBCC domain-containing protein [Bacteroidota bacterium]